MAPVTPSTPNTTSPRDILVGYQLRRENRALLDAFEEQKAKFLAQAQIQKQREEEIERKIQQVEQQNQQITEEIKEKIKEMGEHLREHDVDIKEGVGNSMKEIEESVVKQLSARLPSGTFGFGTDNTQEEEGQQPPRSSPPVLTQIQQGRAPSPVNPQPAAFVPPHQRYPNRRAANAAASGPSSTANTTVNRKENVSTGANLARKRSAVGMDLTPSTPAPATRARSDSSSSTLSTAPSSHADVSEPEIPDLPFNKKGTPTQANLDIDMYFASAAKFARERGVNQESEEEQTAFILQIFKGMKKEERTEVVAALEEVSLAATDKKRRTVQFLGLWDEIAEAVDYDVLMEAKAKVNLMRATSLMA